MSLTSRIRGSAISAYPAAFAAGYVLLSFANFPIPVQGLVRPLVVAIAGALLLSLVLGAIVKSRALGAMLATLVVVSVSATWLVVVAVAAGGLWVLAVSILRRIRGVAPMVWPGINAASRLLGVFGVMFALVACVSAAPAALQTLDLGLPAVPAASDRAAGDRSAGPDIYLMLLDGYPNSDVLARYLNLDNAEFETALRGEGFSIATGSRSNYTATWATLASMFNGAYLDEIDALQPSPADQEGQYLALMKAINGGQALAGLRGRGYRILTAASPFDGATLVAADEVLGGGQITFFELSLLQHSPLLGGLLAVAPDFLLDQQRQRIEATLSATVSVAAADVDPPTFMFAHILSPHPPIVFRANGDLAQLPECFPDTCTLWEMHDQSQWAGFSGQVRWLNHLVIEAVRRLIAADPNAVIIVMSDHGSQPPGAPEEVLLRNFMAVRSPGHPDLFAADAYPVDVIPSLTDAYLGTQTPRHTYQGWLNRAEHPLEMVLVDQGAVGP